MTPSGATLSARLCGLSEQNPELPLYRFLTDGENAVESLSCGELRQTAAKVAVQLHEALGGSVKGERALMLAPQGLNFIKGFFGIQWAGLIATTSQPAHSNRTDRQSAGRGSAQQGLIYKSRQQSCGGL
jgi:acyl-CoA synthetase (AMP-forming)/AMP-acid ligase II